MLKRLSKRKNEGVIVIEVAREIPRNEDGSIASPCLRLCKLDENKQCLACLRSLDEIMAWSKADEVYKVKVWRRISSLRIEPILS